MVSDIMKMENSAYGSSLLDKLGHYWSQAQVNQGFHVQELRSLFGSGV
jgi:hypothetical protein